MAPSRQLAASLQQDWPWSSAWDRASRWPHRPRPIHHHAESPALHSPARLPARRSPRWLRIPAASVAHRASRTWPRRTAADTT